MANSVSSRAGRTFRRRIQWPRVHSDSILRLKYLPSVNSPVSIFFIDMARDTQEMPVSLSQHVSLSSHYTDSFIGGYASPAGFAARLHNATATVKGHGAFSFINSCTYKLGTAVLNHFGRQQMFDLGVSMRMKYGQLLEGFTDVSQGNGSRASTYSWSTSRPFPYFEPNHKIVCWQALPTLRLDSLVGHWRESSYKRSPLRRQG